MKKSLLGLVAIGALIAGPAMAADLSAPMPMKAPPAPPVETWSWTGFYLGGNVGGSWGSAQDTDTFTPTGLTPFPIAIDKTTPSGVIGGGQAGYNWQNGPVVFGIETDIQGSGQTGSATVAGVVTTCGVPCSLTDSDRMTWFGTTRGRLGYAWPNWMIYVTGGAAYGEFNYTSTETFTGGIVPSLVTTGSVTRGGWTVGGGIEGHLWGAWSWKVEYLHMDFGTTIFSVAEPPPLAPGTIGQTFRITDDLVRAGVNYHFNWGGPVAARY